MPTYQYACKECDHAFEAVQSFSDASLTVCPQCSGPLRKVFSSVGVVFKGSGFYRNDSRDSKANTTSGSSSSKTETKSESKSESKTESKSETKSESKSSASSSTGTTKTAAAAS
ncbi:FmdB family zinc ribbon protein [Amycolatopsis alba]|uniref:FmdB family transcriptional regulator n=1 Tax=Amycolatopsis alba DSM 44262 TaxID=1125972 RepID=A0A229RZ13_AMYAL|nr:FmdB family zinc ribbon protein [Amycolatopsis alba]OXM51900.1 FmdB family transcriptional regulator [Amycolatopsis alba DSM 44262]